MTSRSRVWALPATLLLAASLAGCGSSYGGSDGAGAYGAGAYGDTMTSPSPSPSPSTSPSASAAPVAQVATVASAESGLGTILVDGAGMTLYLFTNDTQGSGKSTCAGQCLAAWPPLLGEPQAGTGADEALLGTLTRSEGTTQVTYNGWPLYYWASDTAPGDTTGQGVSDVWWVLDPAGDAIGAP